jgi:hypothetical protein
MDLIGPIGVGLAAARGGWGIRLHQRLIPFGLFMMVRIVRLGTADDERAATTPSMRPVNVIFMRPVNVIFSGTIFSSFSRLLLRNDAGSPPSHFSRSLKLPDRRRRGLYALGGTLLRSCETAVAGRFLARA